MQKKSFSLDFFKNDYLFIIVYDDKHLLSDFCAAS